MPVNKFWWIGTAVTIGSMCIGAIGTAAVLRQDVARHETAIKALTAQVQSYETTIARIDERLKNIEEDIGEIKDLMKNRQAFFTH